MSNKSKVTASNLSSIIFREKASAPVFTRIFSLFPGLGYAAGYKISQRIYKFGGQPWFNDLIRGTPAVRDAFVNTFGERQGKTMMHATAGSLTGIGEVVLLPLDALKIKMQVNPDAFRGRGAFRIFKEEGTTLYRGWGWTMARNAPGSFAVRTQPFSASLTPVLTPYSALWCLRSNKRVRSRHQRLLQSDLDPKLHRVRRGCRRVDHRGCAPGYDQDAYPEPEL